ncbi:hypothetical protein HanRHA438_Chr13g0627901 [Helianthus annuus]|nr:hypothetical protein HanRHA438_Chr13g0627901 [Helianthus annuus]
MNSVGSHIIKYVINIISQMLDFIHPFFNRLISYFLARSIIQQIHDLDQHDPQFLELGVNSLRVSIFLQGFIS